MFPVGMLFTGTASVLFALKDAGVPLAFLDALPLAGLGLGWLLPAVLGVLLGLALPGTCLFVGWERFDLKDAVLTTFMVLSGISGILRSLDREKARQDRDEDRDERTRYNTYRSRALTFRVLFCLNFVILAGCFIGWWRSGEQEVYIQTAVPCMVLFIVGWITRIASDFYYEFKG